MTARGVVRRIYDSLKISGHGTASKQEVKNERTNVFIEQFDDIRYCVTMSPLLRDCLCGKSYLFITWVGRLWPEEIFSGIRIII